MIPMQQVAALMAQSASEVVFTQTTNITTGGNIHTLMGSPAAAGVYRFIINSGVSISSNSTGTPGLQTGTFPAGSTLIIVNNGTIYGMGGAGGSQNGGSPTNAGAGGHAMSLALNVTIDNTSGNIFGGGGGGGVGGNANTGCGNEYGGGGGGGATGLTNSSGGAGYFSGGGSQGTSSGGGAGGSHPVYGWPGGAGGAHGAAGSSGSGPSARSGGAAGKAINLNGFSVTWLGGNNGTQLKGATS
jgi:hypothetical protein